MEKRGDDVGIKEPEIADLRHVIAGDFGVSQTRRVHNYIGAPRVTMSDAVARRGRFGTPSLIPRAAKNS